MKTASSRFRDRSNRAIGGKWLGLAVVFALAVTTASLLSQSPREASAAPIESQCNGEMNGGGTAVACTVTVNNYITAGGALASTPPSTLTMTRCVGATGPISTLTCATTVTTLTQAVTTVQQCNGSGNGGGGMVVCNVTINNHFIGSPGAITPATVYQCVGSVITGTGAPGFCTPANTPGITSVAAATVGQCNSSGNGGGSVAFICTVTAGSTMNAAMAVNVDQCNGSGNGGGALVTCEATVSNQVVPTPTPGPGTPTASATATGSATASPTGSATASPTGSPTASPTGSTTATPTGSTTATPTGATATTTPTPTPTPTATTTPGGSSTPAPRPPATGDSLRRPNGQVPALVLATALAAAGLAFGALGMATRRRGG